MTLEVDITARLGDFMLDVRLESGPGVTALFGRSGAGKSSVINIIAGLVQPDAGRIVVDDRVLYDRALHINLPPRKRRVGYVFQDSRLFPHIKVRHNLSYGQRFTPPSERYVELDHIIDLLGIGHLLERRPPSLSGGERQRVAIGRALLTSPRLLLMDEPLASLDAARKAEILPYIERLRDELGLPIVYVSHQFEEVVRLADQLVVMAGGKVTAAGSLSELVTRPELAAVIGREQTGAVLETRLGAQDKATGLTRLDCPAGALWVPYMDLPPRAPVRVRALASDVAIAIEKPKGLSIQNILPARITSLDDGQGPSCIVRLDASGTPLLAQVTSKSVCELQLVPGRTVYALVKSVAIDRGVQDGA